MWVLPEGVFLQTPKTLPQRNRGDIDGDIVKSDVDFRARRRMGTCSRRDEKIQCIPSLPMKSSR